MMKTRLMLKHTFWLFTAMVGVITLQSHAVEQPNIVFIMVDDLGPGWVDFDGSESKINTPNLERLARSGMVFTQAYAAAPVCSPTRASCITGMTPAQVGYTTHAPGMGEAAYLKKNGGLGSGGAVDAESLTFLPKNLPSYARELKKLGYATAFFGKWHLAGEGSVKAADGIINSKWHPEHYGFDSNLGGCAYGQPKSWFSPYRNGTIPDGEEGEYLTDRLGDEASAYIKSREAGPFHVALWFYSVHSPIKAPSTLVKKNGGNAYLAMLESMDMAVGKVLAALEEIDALDNTLIVFYSDNGGDKPTEGLAEKKPEGADPAVVSEWKESLKELSAEQRTLHDDTGVVLEEISQTKSGAEQQAAQAGQNPAPTPAPQPQDPQQPAPPTKEQLEEMAQKLAEAEQHVTNAVSSERGAADQLAASAQKSAGRNPRRVRRLLSQPEPR